MTGLDALQALLYRSTSTVGYVVPTGRGDVFPISAIVPAVCEDACGLRTTLSKAQEPVRLGSLLLRVLSGSYFKTISE